MSQRTWQGQSAAWQALYTLQIDKVSVEMTQATKNQTILLADDEADLRNLLAEMLETLGYSTIEAAAVPKKCGDWSPISVSMCSAHGCLVPVCRCCSLSAMPKNARHDRRYTGAR